MKNKDVKICIVGLGYVGLPLAVEFGKQFQVLGFDTNNKRVNDLRNGEDYTRETTTKDLREATFLTYTTNVEDLKNSNIFIATVPTPIDKYKRPDLTALLQASEMMGKSLSKGDIVIYESTVYPGATEEDCVPVLESNSGLKFNKDFFVGYSPERINPGDKKNTLTKIRKVTSGSTEEVANYIDDLYGSIITAGTYKAPSIRVAEASKVIENTQRDLNISLINELALIFNKMKIDTGDVLKAAETKWNFLPFRPGLVGGHCIGVDPYYLTHKAQELGYHPEVILAGRRINDKMGEYIADFVLKLLTKKSIHIVNSNILVMGLTFKENCPDLRNTRIVDLITALQEFNANVDVYDPWVDPEEANIEYGISLIDSPQQAKYDAIILAVTHNEFLQLGIDGVHALGKTAHVVYDIKHLFPREYVDARL